MVAPITKPKDLVMNRAVEKVYLPEGTWYDFKTGKKFVGNQRYVLFFKDEDYPVFAKNGSIICMAELEENLNVTNSPKSMEIHVFPGKSNAYNLYEDDGFTNLHKDGYYLLTRVDYNYLANNYTLIIRPIEGKSGIIPDRRDYRVKFRNTREANEVIVYLDGQQIEYTAYVDENDFIVEVHDIDTTKQLTINCKGKDIEIDAVRIINDDIDAIISDIPIKTVLKEEIGEIVFSSLPIGEKRIRIKKLQRYGLASIYVRMLYRLLDYVSQI